VKSKKDVVLGIFAAGFLIGISLKYLLECYTTTFEFYPGYGGCLCSAYYTDWYYPLLDFIPILAIGLFVLWRTYKVVVPEEVNPLNG